MTAGAILAILTAGVLVLRMPLCPNVSGADARAAAEVPAKADYPASEFRWATSMSEALRIAAEKKLPILVHFYSPACGPCVVMDREVFSDARVQAPQKYYVMARVDIQEHPGVLKQYGVQVVPTDMVLSYDGKPIAKSTGQKSRDGYLAFANTTASRQRFAPQQAGANMIASANVKPVDESPMTAQVVVVAAPALQEPVLPMIQETKSLPFHTMLEGYCAVTLVEEEKWLPGNLKFGVSHRGQVYLFASEEKAEKFFRNPDHYALAAGGNDVVKLMDFKEHQTGKREYGLRYDGVNFVFASEKTREIFRKNPEKYIMPLRIEMLRTAKKAGSEGF